eukprot:1846726-Karenia_brevis.AAC.1
MASIYIDYHLSDLMMKKDKVVKLLVARQGSLRQQLMEHINIDVDEAYPPEKFATDSGAIPESIRSQDMETGDNEPHAL